MFRYIYEPTNALNLDPSKQLLPKYTTKLEHRIFKTIYVSNIPIKTTETELKDHFQRYFGEVDVVVIKKKFRNSKLPTKQLKFAYAFIKFYNHDAAMTATSQTKHTFKTKRIRVYRANDWIQTDRNLSETEADTAEEKLNKKNKKRKFLKNGGKIIAEKASISSSDVPNLLSLDNFTLLRIFRYLHYEDLEKFIQMGGRLQYVASLAMNKYEKFNFREDVIGTVESRNRILSPELIRSILLFVGPHIKDLILFGEDIRDVNVRSFDIIYRHCPNLEKLRLINFKFSNHLVERKLQLFMLEGKLKYLIFNRCSLLHETNRNELKPLSFPQSLTHLKFTKCHNFPTFLLKNMNLKELNINDTIFHNSLHIFNHTTIDFLSCTRYEAYNGSLFINGLEKLKCLKYLSANFDIFALELMRQQHNANRDFLDNLIGINISGNMNNVHLSQVFDILAERNKLEALFVIDSNINLRMILNKFTNLSYVKIDKGSEINETGLMNLSRQSNLHYLSINDIPITNLGLSYIINYSPNLTLLESFLLTYDHIQEMVLVLNEIASRPLLFINGIQFMTPETRNLAMQLQDGNPTRIKFIDEIPNFFHHLANGNQDILDILNHKDDYKNDEFEIYNRTRYIPTDDDDDDDFDDELNFFFFNAF